MLEQRSLDQTPAPLRAGDDRRSSSAERPEPRRVMTYGPVDIVAFLAKGNLEWRVLNLQARVDVPDADVPRDCPLNIVNNSGGISSSARRFN
jgi:hypothetical protein